MGQIGLRSGCHVPFPHPSQGTRSSTHTCSSGFSAPQADMKLFVQGHETFFCLGGSHKGGKITQTVSRPWTFPRTWLLTEAEGRQHGTTLTIQNGIACVTVATLACSRLRLWRKVTRIARKKHLGSHCGTKMNRTLTSWWWNVATDPTYANYMSKHWNRITI